MLEGLSLHVLKAKATYTWHLYFLKWAVFNCGGQLTAKTL